MSQAGELNVVQNHPEIPTEFITNAGTAIPILNQLEILGTGSITTTGASNIVTIHFTGSALEQWNTISASQALVVDNGYICVSPGGALLLSLPATSALGDLIEVTLDGATSWQITQGAGQTIKIGAVATTAGVGGSLTSTQQGDSIRMICSVANLRWNVVSSMGNPVVV